MESDQEIYSDDEADHQSVSSNNGEGINRNGNDVEEQDNEGNDTEKIDPAPKKKRVIRAPVPKLNIERLKGPKGIHTIEEYFKGFKTYGKGHEGTDLDRIMKRLEHWAHRLFPKYRFDDFIEKMETLGTKKDLHVYLKKYRLNMISFDDAIISDKDEDENNIEQDESIPLDAFDLLLEEQIRLKRNDTNSERPNTTAASKSLHDDISPVKSISSNVSVLVAESSSESISLDNAIKEKIERNRQLAIKKKLARQKAREEENMKKMEEANSLQPTHASSNVIIHDKEDNDQKPDTINASIISNHDSLNMHENSVQSPDHSFQRSREQNNTENNVQLLKGSSSSIDANVVFPQASNVSNLQQPELSNNMVNDLEPMEHDSIENHIFSNA
ncbi:TIMELESS-interacting protein [Orussus abietinus]|uniref:TIMELESS-interacting protein n=1 Tax=Orussus abietinus TaxID=222816 RepID=UPI000625C817|nr:TIMELESS-interacting protein [Orussus abietinus]